MTAVLAVAAVFLAVAMWSAADRRRRLLARVRAEWGAPRQERADVEGIADFFQSHDAGPDVLDDRTWNDLLLDQVFAQLDCTQSSVGQQILYYRLRRAPATPNLPAFEALVGRFEADDTLRERAQVALARMRNAGGYYVHRLARGTVVRPAWYVVFPVWTAVLVTTLLLSAVWHGLLLFVLFGLVVNFGVRMATGRRVGSEAMWFRQVGPLISTAHALVECGSADTTPVIGTMRDDLAALRGLGAIARWVSRGGDSGTPLDIVGSVLEYVNIQLLMDVNALYFASRELATHGPHLLRLIEAVGECDAAIATMSFRTSRAGRWSRPQFAAAGSRAEFTGLRHPLIDDAVPNSITMAPPNGVLITGSNMSGKSTFLRTVGVNAVLAQSVHTCLAESYRAPAYRVRTCIGREDDLLAGKSYYLVEVESVLALVAASGRAEPHLFIFDELFRGTNAVERVAAGEAILRSLVEHGKPHVVLAATHDGELVELLSDCYVVYHLGDSIDANGLTFDYQLAEGPATSRNAIALLKLNGAPEPLVRHALARAAELDRQRRAATARS